MGFLFSPPIVPCSVRLRLLQIPEVKHLMHYSNPISMHKLLQHNYEDKHKFILFLKNNLIIFAAQHYQACDMACIYGPWQHSSASFFQCKLQVCQMPGLYESVIISMPQHTECIFPYHGWKWVDWYLKFFIFFNQPFLSDLSCKHKWWVRLYHIHD